MKPILLHIYGPIAIHSYGLCIAIGLVLFMFFVRQHPLFEKLKLEPIFNNVVALGIFSGLLGGRILHLISEGEPFWDITRWFTIWEGGFAILGGIIGILAVVPWYIHSKGVSVLAFLDLVSIYTPLLQSVSRVGCFLAGCCYGLGSGSSFAITYTDPTSFAPINLPIHPTQLYSSFALFCIFMFLMLVLQKILNKSGLIFSSYLMLESAERFFIDFLRADREMVTAVFSTHQVVAALLFLIGATLFIYIYKRHSVSVYFPYTNR